MALKPGTMLGHYEIRALIGVGGMGEVYRAHDTVLARDVALKVLPEAFARDPDRIARFRREARLLASLNHPNIAAIYGLEEDKGTHFLVMELVLGDTLRDRITRDGPVPLEEAVAIAKQIAEALEAAHEKPIIHRDLKPANIKVTPEGKVKVLDFGLAKAFAGGDSETDIENAPTLTASPTIPGAILGTPAYMSPEQAKGKKVDKRADIWALGCVLYELLTGQGAFHRYPSRANQSRDREGAGRWKPGVAGQSPDRKGGVASPAESPLPGGRGSDDADTLQNILARVLQADPDWTALPESTPHGIRFLLRRCLQKDATKRFRDAADIQIQIEESLSAQANVEPLPAPAGWWRAIPWAVALLAVIVASIALLSRKPEESPGGSGVARLTIALPPGEQLADLGAPSLALSPDGSQLAYIGIRGGVSQLYVRALDSMETKPLPGAEGGAPFFSPDGQWIGFFSQGKLKKVSITGGSLQILCDATSARGGS